MKFLGKILFPHLPAWQQRQRVNTMLVVLLIAVFFAIFVGAGMYYVNTKR